MSIPPCFSTIFTRGNNFNDFVLFFWMTGPRDTWFCHPRKLKRNHRSVCGGGGGGGGG